MREVLEADEIVYQDGDDAWLTEEEDDDARRRPAGGGEIDAGTTLSAGNVDAEDNEAETSSAQQLFGTVLVSEDKRQRMEQFVQGKAATKVQAQFRGKKAREAVAALRPSAK